MGYILEEASAAGLAWVSVVCEKLRRVHIDFEGVLYFPSGSCLDALALSVPPLPPCRSQSWTLADLRDSTIAHHTTLEYPLKLSV